MLEDIDIWQGVKQGDTQAFGTLYATYWEELYHSIYWRVCDRDVAKDLVQELFIYLWEERDAIEIKSSIAGYLKVMARNHVLNYFKMEAIRKKHTESAGYHLPVEIDVTQARMEVKEIEKKHWQAIEKLPERMKAIYLLSREKDCSIATISEQLSLAPQTVKNQLTAAVKKVRSEMEPHLRSARPGERRLLSLLLGIYVFY